MAGETLFTIRERGGGYLLPTTLNALAKRQPSARRYMARVLAFSQRTYEFYY